MCGGDGNGGVDPTGPQPSCEALHERTTLNSVNPAAIPVLKVGDILTVVAQSPTGPLAVVHSSGTTVGAITSASAARILECIQNGHNYVAVIQTISGAQIVVLIRHK